MQKLDSPRAAFTLIELSIVLIIIGLIVGGVFVGKDMMKAAELRKVVTQTEQYATAMNTFKLKYGCLAGDCPNATELLGASGNGDGNGKIDGLSCRVSTPGPELECYAIVWNDVAETDQDGNSPGLQREELTLVNEHMARAQLLPIPTFNRNDMAQMKASGNYKLGLRDNLWLFAMTAQGKNILFIGGDTRGMYNDRYYVFGGQYALRPSEAYFIDTKIDDGKPNTGSVKQKQFPIIPLDGHMEVCRWPIDATSNEYNASDRDFTVPLYPCALSIDAAF